MSAAVLASLQRKLRIYSVVLLVAVTPLGFIAAAPVLAHGPAQGPVSAYNVTFMSVNGSAPTASGSASFFSTVSETVKVGGENLTGIAFAFTYTDQSLSPFTNPSVTITINPPNGTVVNGSGQPMSVQAGGATILLFQLNKMPQNTTVDATSEQDAIAMAGMGSNATLGTGDWTVQIEVGAAALGRIRPSGSITFQIEVTTDGFVGKATKI